MGRTGAAVQRDKFGWAVRLNPTVQSLYSFLEMMTVEVEMVEMTTEARAKRTTVNTKGIASLEIYNHQPN